MNQQQPKTGSPSINPELLKPIEPFQLFDELYYIGSKIVGIYVLKTNEGLVLLDSTDHVDAINTIVIPSLKKLGLENEKILTVLLTHGHFDHYLGAESIRNYTGCEVGLSLKDTAYMAWSQENMGDNKPKLIPRITKILNDGETLTYGSHSIYVMEAPGHTPGCLNFGLTVHDHGKPHHVILMGGYGVFGPGQYDGEPYPYGVQWAVDNALLFASSCVKTWEYCKTHHCDVYLNPHPHLCNLFEAAKKNETRSQDAPNAFVIGTAGVRTWLVERFNVCIDSAQKFTDIQQEYR